MEIAGAFAVLFVNQSFVMKSVAFLTDGELSEDPKDAISNYLVHAASLFSVQAQHATFFYLLIHGAVKVLLVWGLIKEKMWAYPATLAVLGIFILYQTYKMIVAFSPWLLALTIFDIVIIILVWHEYRLHTTRIRKS